MSNKEINDLIISWLTISFAFAWISTNFFGPGGTSELIGNIIVMLIAVGTGFILHELAHKYVAIHYGAHAEFRAWRHGLILAIAMALFAGFVFAAPGAVYVSGRSITVKQNGHISLAGPLTNLITVMGFGLLLAILNPTEFITTILVTAMYVNFFLAAFNLIPIFPLDGSKVFMWNKTAWVISMALAASGVLFFQYYLAFFSTIAFIIN